MDYSETSFQIPSTFDDERTRLKDTEFDFDAFDDDMGLDADPFATPHPNTKKHAPLMLEDLTPQVERNVSPPEASASAGKVDREGLGGVQQNWSLEEPHVSVRPLPAKKAPVDDFFERRKRDNYLQMGLDLSSKSTARYRNDESIQLAEQEITPHQADQSIPEISSDDLMEFNLNDSPEQPTNMITATIENVPPVPIEAIEERAEVIANTKQNKRRSLIIGASNGVMKQKSRSTAAVSTKSILKGIKSATGTLPPSTLTRTVEKVSHVPEFERPKLGEVAQETQQRKRRESTSSLGAFGNGLMDVLMNYGEKLRDSFGFSNSKKCRDSLTATTAPDSVEPGMPISVPNTQLPSSHDILTVSQLSPSKSLGQKQENLPRDDPPSPMRTSTKRPSTGTLPRERKKGKTDENTVVQPSTLAPLNKKPNSKMGSIANKSISKPRPLGNSQSVNRPGRTGTIRSKSSRPDSSISSSKGKVSSKGDSVNSRKGPLLASDVYHQLAADKVQNEGKENAQHKDNKTNIVPQFPKPVPPARPTVRPTIPTAFTFQSDLRISQRRSQIEEKKKTEDNRPYTSRHRLPVPDFAPLHTTQEEGASKKKVSVPVIPEAPTLTTMIRAKEREKFDQDRKQREIELQRLRERRERERAQQEEKSYKEARKKTVYRAHEVPEWYKDVPRKKGVE